MSDVRFNPGADLPKAPDISLDGLAISSPMARALAELSDTGEDLAAYLQLMHGIAWETTSLGPLDQWSQELATQFYLMMLNPAAQNLILGPEAIVVYNPTYGALIRDHHPSFFGKPVETWLAWEPYFPDMQRVIGEAARVGRAVEESDLIMYISNNGIMEEVSLFITVVRLPRPLAGFLGTLQDNTQAMVRERRISSLKEFSECWKTASDLDELWTKMVQQLSSRSRQFCFTALYTATLSDEAGNISDSSNNEVEDVAYVLHETCLGYEKTPDNLKTIDLVSHAMPVGSLMWKAYGTRAPVLMSRQDIPETWHQLAKSHGFEDEVQNAMILPSSSNKLSKVQAFLILGLCTRRNYDDGYRTFLLEVQRLLADTVNNLISARDAVKKKTDLAKRARIEKELMEKELVLRREQAELAHSKVGRLSATAESVEVGIFEQKITGEVIEANEAYYRISGSQKNPIDVVEAFKMTVFPEDIATISAEWQAVAAGQNRTFELRYRNGNFGLAACVPLRDKNGVVTSIHGVLTNITAFKRIDANERRFHRFIEIVPAGILITDSLARVIYANEDWFKVTAHPRVPLEEINWIDVVSSETQPYLLEKFHEVLAGNEITFELKMKRQYVDASGQVCGPAWCMVKALPETNEESGVERCITTAMDISHQKYAESMQKTRLQEALEAKRQQENFVDLVSHEIRNPLGAIVHCADSISESLSFLADSLKQGQIPDNVIKKMSDSGESVKEAIDCSLDAVETISSCASHIRNVADDILTLSKLDSNMLKIAPIPVSSERLMQDIYKFFSVEAKREEIDFETCVDISISQLKADWVVIDPGRVTQVIVNLVTNALKFSKKETRPVRSVRVEMGVSHARPTYIPVDWTIASSLRDNVFDNAQFPGQDTCHLWFKVTDHGCGMTPEEQSRIFTRFSQGSIRTHSSYGGSGLGLWICRTLVELQGGEIGVASKPGMGSTFAFYVRTHCVDPPDTEKAPLTRAKSNKTLASTFAAGGHNRPITVLIIEDNLINQRVLKQQLTKQGYVTHVSNNGQEALNFLENTRHWKHKDEEEQDAPSGKELNDVDVVLCDMEVMDGLTFARKVRALQRSGDITTECLPIISVSANARTEQIRMAMEAGMDDSISKPFRIPDLTPKINRLANWARSKT